MNRKPTSTPVEPWEWFSGCLYHMSKSQIVKIWNVGERAVEKWSADPSTTATTAACPMTRLGYMLTKLMMRGQVEHARSGVDYLARIVRCTLIPDEDECTPNNAALEEELLDNYESLAAYTAAMRDPEASNAKRRELARLAIEDIMQDLTLLKD